MNYQKEEIKEGITLHQIHTENFKTNLFALFIATPLKRENITQDALMTAVLRRGTQNLPSQELISKELETMYGASFDCGVEKTGDNHIIKFYLETLSEEFLPQKENLTQKCIEILLDIVFNPVLENGAFKKEYVEGEKQNLKQIIEGKIDNKNKYSYERCIEEMFKNKPYGLYKFGYTQDLEAITPESLYQYYQQLLSNCKIDIFCSGILDQEKTKAILQNNQNIQKLATRKPEYIINNEQTESKEQKAENVVTEAMQVTQGKLVMGLDICDTEPNSRFTASVYNAILGGGANSKLFQNVREKQSLAYTASSNYVRTKNSIFIRCGIEIPNYEKAVKTIKEQLEDMKNGKFTDEDLENAKTLIIATIDSIPAEQDTEMTYYYGQELSDSFVPVEEYVSKIKAVTKQQVEDLAKTIQVNTIYFLKN